MQKQLGLGAIVKVAGLTQQHEVRYKRGPTGNVFAQLRVFVSEQAEPAEGPSGGQHE
ncbi:hypothetical protein D3C85_1817640 [compost metagenome]